MPDSRGGKNAAKNELLVSAGAGETRVAILEQGQFTELYIERDSDRSVTGTVALGRVTRVLPGMQAAFVDIGLEKAAFLYVGDFMDENTAAEADEPRGRRRGRSNRQPAKIETLLQEGQEIIVQVAKDPIGTKGARITSNISVAGRHLVLTPWSQRVGVSRRIDSDRERRRLRDAVSRYRPKDLGFIIRTAGLGTSDADLESDIRYLTQVWDDVQIRKDQVRAPATLYTELSLALRVIRDFANANTKRIVVDDPESFAAMQDFLTRFVADPKPKLERYEGSEPIFDHFGIEPQIDANLGRKVWLKSGGYLIIDQSEALTAIDVNTGRYVGRANLEETVLRTNLEAVAEVVNQLRFRNIGGLIIIDLIDMETAANRDKVYRALREALRADKSKTNILKISELGLVEMTRKRTRENLVQQLCEPCNYCEGRGYVLSAESVGYKVLREVRKDLLRFCGRRIAVTVHPQVAEMLQGPARRSVAALGEALGREIEICARPGQHQEQFELTALDEGPPVALDLPWLAGWTRPEGSGEAGDDPGAAGESPLAAAEGAPDAGPLASEEEAQEASEEEAQGEDPRASDEEAPDEDPLAAAPREPESPLVEPEPATPEVVPAEREAPLHFGSAPEPELLDGAEEKPILPRSAKPEEP
ncbi:MAG: Rne/Rng family ribonuclease [Myxococcota bacterium]|nr:Rne/Rng family ribonuclease [Myxococcota bacterium]